MIALTKLVIMVLCDMLLVEVSGRDETVAEIMKEIGIIVENIEEKPKFNFLDVIKLNKKYSPAINICSRRLIGGVQSKVTDAPYQVAFRQIARGGRLLHTFCGGAIVTEEHVLTAAHCLLSLNISLMVVVAGTIKTDIWLKGKNKSERLTDLRQIKSKECWRRIAAGHCHAGFRKGTALVNDIGVAQLNEPLQFSDTIQPIRMQTKWSSEKGSICLVSGFGRLGSTPVANLRRVCVAIVNYRYCSWMYALHSEYTHICAGGWNKDTCQGDSGSPMVCNGYLVGVVSFGIRFCGFIPSVYTHVGGYTSGAKIPFAKCRSVRISYNILLKTIALVVTYIYFIDTGLVFL